MNDRSVPTQTLWELKRRGEICLDSQKLSDLLGDRDCVWLSEIIHTDKVSAFSKNYIIQQLWPNLFGEELGVDWEQYCGLECTLIERLQALLPPRAS